MSEASRRDCLACIVLLSLCQIYAVVVPFLPSHPTGGGIGTRGRRRKAVPSRTFGFLPAASPSSSWVQRYHDIRELKEGDLVISRVESSLGCHDLRQPYFHKAVVLILDHDPEDFTQGVLLNRASDLILSDQDIIYEDEEMMESVSSSSNYSTKWNIHFGGDIGSWYEEEPNFVCLHTIASDAALAVSDPVILESWDDGGIFVTSHLGARSLVASGEANSTDFFTFCGFCGWEAGQLQTEVDRGSWYLASLTEQNAAGNDEEEYKCSALILWDKLQSFCWKTDNYRPESAAIEFWRELVTAMGMEAEVGDLNSFTDLMLKEWATQRLLVAKNETDEQGQPAVEIGDNDIFRAVKAASMADEILPGTIFRGSSEIDSPFLLKDQLFHKSIILLLQEDSEASVGIILNLPTTETYTLDAAGIVHGKPVVIPIRYGGPSGKATAEQPLFWLHDNLLLKEKGVGRCLFIQSQNCEPKSSGFPFVCTEAEVAHAIQDTPSTKDDFILVRGFTAWGKEVGSRGMLGEVQAGNFEMVSKCRVGSVFQTLLAQQALSEKTLRKNVRIQQKAWVDCGDSNKGEPSVRCVYESDTTVAALADASLRNWIQIFILAGAENYDYVA